MLYNYKSQIFIFPGFSSNLQPLIIKKFYIYISLGSWFSSKIPFLQDFFFLEWIFRWIFFPRRVRSIFSGIIQCFPSFSSKLFDASDPSFSWACIPLSFGSLACLFLSFLTVYCLPFLSLWNFLFQIFIFKKVINSWDGFYIKLLFFVVFLSRSFFCTSIFPKFPFNNEKFLYLEMLFIFHTRYFRLRKTLTFYFTEIIHLFSSYSICF